MFSAIQELVTVSISNKGKIVTSLIPSNFHKVFSNISQISQQSNHDFFVLFTGEKVPETGKSWCPDCVNAEPIINKALEQYGREYILLLCPVVRLDYRSHEYIYRIDDLIQLKCVPTFMKIKENQVIARLNDQDSQIERLVLELISN